ncbi:polysaccharide deacetylase family protein [Aurantimonas sp. HBX-1]|uniref:polysaccharide deacetylase family protein n=1 Tax=Aurantimonas sp. HBX-1 TaxID=2906072 RepID=UPI001F1F1852|nr:polysaccharide deacetylase family protein [Aurantimonas sp. HBX-1]UIJ72038.1 polysaccharide deacetylase family protein [Aurantimonas sp. HBX-1]
MGELIDELDRWADEGRRLEAWWRDDDAVRPSPALGRLTQAASSRGLPLALAVIPAAMIPELAGALADPCLTVLQHGFAHRNHAVCGARAVECGGVRQRDALLGDLAAGRDRLEAMFGARFVPALVPPWNRIEPDVVRALPGLAYRGVSLFGSRPSPPQAAGFAEINTHLDLLTWKGGARFAGRDKLIRLAAERIADRRLGRTDPQEPFGLLTHHLDHDGQTWDFLGELLDTLAAHGSVRFRGAASLFAAAPAPEAGSPRP